MKINFNEELKNLKNEVIKQPIVDEKQVDENGVPKIIGMEPVTLGIIARNALMGIGADEKNITGDKKFRRYQLSTNIFKSEQEETELNLVSEDITLIKKIIGDRFSPIIVGVCWNLLEKTDK